MQEPHSTSVDDASALSLDDGDNITLQVSSRPSAGRSTEELSMASIDGGVEPPTRSTRPRTNRPWGRQGKGVVLDDAARDPVQEPEKVTPDPTADSTIEEKDESMMCEEIFDGDDDVKSIITVSSSPEMPEVAPFGMSERPWKIETFSKSIRQHWEMMYSTIQQTPLAGDWDMTEAYQKEKDREMLMYIQDFPLATWVIPKEQAEIAYTQLIERIRWRSLGIAIYDQARIAHMAFQRTMGAGMNTAHGYASYQQQSHALPPNMHHGSQVQVPPVHSHLPTHLSGHNLHTFPTVTPSAHRQGEMPQPAFNNAPDPASHGQSKAPRFKLHGPKPQVTKNEKDSPAATSPTQSAPVPPYAQRYKPVERKLLRGKGNRGQSRKQAEAEVYPWHRQFDFVEAKVNAYWDDSGYDQDVLSQMARTRRDNRPIILQLDDEQSGKQRMLRQKKAGKSTDTEGAHSRKSAAGSEPFPPGKFSFASDEDARKATVTNCETPDDIIAAAEAGKIDAELCKDIMICWNPGKKGATERLFQSSFRIYDTLITRQQFAHTRILTRRASECIIDFCPNLLWRETLLRIVSEGGLGNKDVRDRFCLNGCYADKATITKRIAAALGQKQAPPKAKDGSSDRSERKDGRDESAEENHYVSNGADFDAYIRFFGKRQSTRNQSRMVASSSKRHSSDEDAEKHGSGSKKMKLESSNVSVEDEGEVGDNCFANAELDEEEESAADSPQQEEEDHVMVPA